METKGFNGSEISEKNKEALQSEAWQEVRKIMKTEIQHFTEAPKIQHFATVKVSKNDNVYGVVWGNVVRHIPGKMHRRMLYQMALHIKS